MKKKTFLEVGKITSTHGVRGFVKITAWCDDVCLFKSLSFLYFDDLGKTKKYIEKLCFKKNIVLIKFNDINSLENAKKIIGNILYIDRKEIKLKDGEVFIEDLIGVKIHNYKNKEICYGEITDVIKTGANDVYIIKDEYGKQKLIPVIDEVIIEKDLDRAVIYINVLEGLFDV